jgi:hypothetical protein
MPHPEDKKPGLLTRFITRLRSKRFAYLTKFLVVLILGYPYLEVDLPGQIILTAITIMVMVSLVIAVSDRKRDYVIALCLAIPWFVVLIINFPVFEADRSIVIRKEIVFAVLLFFYTTIRIFVHLIKSREVTTEILFAAVCVYLLIGLSWAALYLFIDFVSPGSFIDTSDELATTAPRFLFFSYVTLTTVGYGTLVPATDQARSIAMIEAIVGQLYLTILVARLVGLHISKPKAPDSGG